MEIFLMLFGGMAVFFSFLVVFAAEPIMSALSLFMVFFCVAALYALLGSHLLAGLQILIYTGAVLVLFIFVMMLLQPQKEHKRPLKKILVGVIPLAALLGFLGVSFLGLSDSNSLKTFSPEAVEALGGNTRVLSLLLFSEYVFPFELISFLLLAAIIATVSLAKRKPILKKGA